MLGRAIARRLGFLPWRRKASAATRIKAAADLPEVDLMFVDREIALALCHRKVIAREF